MTGRETAGRNDRTTIACLQMESAVGDPEHNIATALRMVRAGAEAGARLMVLPELCTSGYVLSGREEAYAVSESIPDGRASSAFADVCRETGAYVVAGIAERAGARLYNSAALFGPEGYVGTYRKLHLWHTENLFFEPGDGGIAVFPTRIGRIGLAICYDAWFPEVFRGCAARGADVVAMPVNWVPGPADAPGELPIGVTMGIAGAIANGMVIAVADRVGEERGERFLGSSALIGERGLLLSPVAGETGEEIVHGEIDLAEVRAARTWGPYNHLLHDRRTEVYGELP